MGRITRELKTLPGMILGTTIALIVVFFVWNFLASRGLPFVSPAAAWIESHANGSVYGGGAAPAASTASVSYQGPGF